MPSITDVSYTDITDENKEVQIDLKVLSERMKIQFIIYYLGMSWKIRKVQA